MSENDEEASEYKHYLESDGWRELRSEVLKRDGWRCRLCNRAELVEIHHRTYQRIYRERPEDLTTLCHWCHERHHGSVDAHHRRCGSITAAR